MEIHDLYEAELKTEFKELDDIDNGSDEHRKAVVDISQLTDRYVRLKEVNIEAQKIEIEKQKIKIEREKMEDERKSRTVQIGKDVMAVIVPAAITGVGMVLMFLFEVNGTITSKAGSKIVDRMFRSK